MKSKTSILNNEKGMALLETIPLLVVFVMLMSFGMGLFGVVHTATLHSIAARTYAFETFRQRTNLTYLREDRTGLTPGTTQTYAKKGWRFHAVQHETDQREIFVATVRPIALGDAITRSNASADANNNGIFQMPARNDRIDVNPVWIMVGYGICMNAACGQ